MGAATQRSIATRPSERRWTLGAATRASAVYGTLLLGVVVMLVPFAYMVGTSFTPNAYVLPMPPVLIPSHPTFANYIAAWNTNDFGRAFLNSLEVAVSATALGIGLSSALAFAFARYRFPGRNILFFGMLATLMVPSIVLIIPQFVLASHLHLTNSKLGLILVYAATNGTAFSVYLLRNAFAQLPQEMLDAAAIDGCGVWLTFLRIALPLVRPALSAAVIFAFLGNWDEFTWAYTSLNNPRALHPAYRHSAVSGRQPDAMGYRVCRLHHRRDPGDHRVSHFSAALHSRNQCGCDKGMISVKRVSRRTVLCAAALGTAGFVYRPFQTLAMPDSQEERVTTRADQGAGPQSRTFGRTALAMRPGEAASIRVSCAMSSHWQLERASSLIARSAPSSCQLRVALEQEIVRACRPWQRSREAPRSCNCPSRCLVRRSEATASISTYSTAPECRLRAPATADVLDTGQAPRYGFMSDFEPGDPTAAASAQRWPATTSTWCSSTTGCGGTTR